VPQPAAQPAALVNEHAIAVGGIEENEGLRLLNRGFSVF